jgi:hypothetical protein
MAMSGVQLRARREDLLVVLATGLFAAGLCFVQPTVFESGDYVLYWKPTFQFLADAVRAGGLPLWNPYVGLGRPFLADMQNPVFYPPVYLICAGREIGVFLLVWLHGLLAILGMRRLGGALGAGRWQSYFMGFSFLASGELTARWMAGQITYCWGLCFVPWLFYYALRTEERWQSRRLAQYAVYLALQFLCGHPQVFWFSAIGQAVFILTRALRLPLSEAIRDAGQRLGQFGVACVWCSGLVAVVLLPMLELVKESNRSQNSPAFANSYNMVWTDLHYLFSPLQSAGARWESNLFVGTLIVVLGLAGLCLVRERNVRGLLGMLVIGLLIALGDKTPCFGLFYKWLPGYAGFRFHSRAGLLVVVALICAAGIWLGRPHPGLRAVWTYLFGVPVRYAILLLVLLQSLDLLQGTWMVKGVITYVCSYTAGTPLEHSFEQTLVAELRKADLIKPLLPPPRVCVPPTLVPVNYGMIYHYGNLDAACSLFVRRPWDYLHAVLGIPPAIEKGSLSRQVYNYAPFPYRGLSLSIGVDPRNGRLAAAPDPSPRAFVVYGAEVADYGTVLNRLAHGHDIRQCALLEEPLAKPLPQRGAWPGTAAAIRRFEPNCLLVDVEARTNALLVLAEAWYPGWRAEIDGQAGACVPANIWMRAVPVPAGRHLVRVYFRQNYLLPGFLISLASVGLSLVAVAKPGRRMPAPPREGDPLDLPTAPRAGGNRRLKQQAPALARHPSAFSAYRPLLRALAAGTGLAFAWLVARTEIQQVRRFQSTRAEVDAMAHCQIGDALALQHQTAQAMTHFSEAVRRAERACKLTGYREPLPLGTLACAYAGAGRFDDAFATASKGRDRALASGQNELAGSLLKLMEYYNARKPVRGGDRN